LIKAILQAPVDLLYNGGIGTYVKASTQSHQEANDRGNDILRVDASQLQARVIGEGGNLGLTQKAASSLRCNGGRIFHRRDRQLGRRGLLRPRGQHQDPARRADPSR
jgi:glutamate dehydrogenase